MMLDFSIEVALEACDVAALTRLSPLPYIECNEW